MKQRKSKVLISGCSGFLGHHIIKECQDADMYVVGVDKRPIPRGHSTPDHFIQTDVMDLGYRDLMDIDYVIHLAFVTNIPNSVRHPRETTYGNIDMTVHLLEVCREAGIDKFIFPSTASLYSHNPTPWTEDMEPFPIEPYSWQKLSCEYLCKMYSRVYDLKTVIFRFFQVYGELQREDTALSKFFELKEDGKPITLTETTAQSTFKSGQRDFIYAGDLANAVVMSLFSDKTGGGEVFNVSSGEFHTMEDIAKAVGGEVKWIPRRRYEVERHHGNISKIKDVVGWEPKTNVIEWIKLYENNKK